MKMILSFAIENSSKRRVTTSTSGTIKSPETKHLTPGNRWNYWRFNWLRDARILPRTSSELLYWFAVVTLAFSRRRTFQKPYMQNFPILDLLFVRKGRARLSCKNITLQICVKMQLACFLNVLKWWLLIKRNQSEWPDSWVLLAFAFHLARQPLCGNSIAPSSRSCCPFVVLSFFGYLLLVIVHSLFPFQHVAHRNVAPVIDWREKKCTRNASLRARNSGLWPCWARDFFLKKLDHCVSIFIKQTNCITK